MVLPSCTQKRNCRRDVRFFCASVSGPGWRGAEGHSCGSSHHSSRGNEPANEPDGGAGVLSSSPGSAGGSVTASLTGSFENTAIECMKSCVWLFSLWSAVSVSCKSFEQIHREKGLIFAKGFHISVGDCSGGFSTSAGFVWVSVLEQPFHCFGFQGQCLNHLNSCLLLTYWPGSLLIAYFPPHQHYLIHSDISMRMLTCS